MLSAVGQVFAYRVGIQPTLDYQPAARPRLTIRQLLGGLVGMVGYGIAGYLSAMAGRRADAPNVGIKVGLMVGLVTLIIGACASFIEWRADYVPERRMGVFGIGLILVGFSLQSVQYWVSLLDVSVR